MTISLNEGGSAVARSSAPNLSRSGDEIDVQLASARNAYTERYPLSRAAYEDARTALPGGSTRTVLTSSPFPIVMERAEKGRLYDVDGNAYVNVLSEFTAGLFGLGFPTIKSAISSALDRRMNYGAHSKDEARFSQLLRRFLPNCEKFRFTSSGSEANTLAIAAALAHTKRKKVLVFDGGYHAGGLSFNAPSAPLNLPHQFVVATYNDVEETRRIIREVGEDLGAVMLELMLGSGGGVPGDPEFISMLRDETKAVGATLIFDEVQTSRFGIGGLQKKLGVTPDLTTVGKFLGGGLPFGAVGGCDEIMMRFDWAQPGAWSHPGTFNNHVLTMAAGCAALETLLEPGFLEALNERGDQFRERLNVLGDTAGVGLQAKGVGSIFTIHWSETPLKTVEEIRRVDGRLRDLLYLHLIENGIWAARRGLMALNVDLGERELSTVENVVGEFISRYASILPRSAKGRG